MVSKGKEINSEEFEKILSECEAKMSGLSEDDWQDIIDRHGLDINRDTLRKNCTGIFGSVFVKQYYEEKNAKEEYSDNAYIQKLEDKKRELEREKIKFRDERNAWNKQNYANARLEETLHLLEDNLKQIGNVEFKVHEIPDSHGEKELIICLSDLHIGQTFDSYFGKYNTDIAKQRLNQYLNKIIQIGRTHDIGSVNVVNLGDTISGSIHKTLQITNKENVIEQIKIASELIASFCYELTNEFNSVKYFAINGNHDRLDKKEDALHDERYGDLINWAVDIMLANVDNFHYLNHRNLDNGIADINVLGRTYLACHGDFDPMSKQGVANLSFMLGVFPTAILRGHMHYPAMSELNGVQVIQSGSVAGCGDSYTIEKRLNGRPSQTTLVCDKNGIECIYNIQLD